MGSTINIRIEFFKVLEENILFFMFISSKNKNIRLFSLNLCLFFLIKNQPLHYANAVFETTHGSYALIYSDFPFSKLKITYSPWNLPEVKQIDAICFNSGT